MKLNICILYPDLLNSYGDTGNAALLAHRVKEHGFEVEVHNISLNDDFRPDLYDIVLMGGGQIHEQSIVAQDLRSGKGEKLREYVHTGKVTLLICSSYQLAGDYYVDDNGKRTDGLGILPIYTDSATTRMIGDLVIEDADGINYIGFENHFGKTYIGDLEPLGHVVSGFGNNGEDGFEGCRFMNTIGTYLHGPLLAKNPELADWMIKTALSLQGENVELMPLDNEWEIAARRIIVERVNSMK